MGVAERAHYSRLPPAGRSIPASSPDSDFGTSPPSRRCRSLCLSIVLLLLIVSPIVTIFYINLFVIEHEDDADGLMSSNRAQIYSIEEFLYKDSSFVSPQKTAVDSSKSEPLKLVCYYNYPQYENNTPQLLPEDITCDLCTHIIVAFASIKNNSLQLNKDIIRTITEIVKLKKCNKELKILLSVGGAGDDYGFANMVSNHTTRKTFIRSVKSFLTDYAFDGIDLDWEFPTIGFQKQGNHQHLLNANNNNRKVDKRQRQHFTQLMREIRMEYNREHKTYLLTVAVAAPSTIVNSAYDIEEMNKYVDFVNVMSYDFHSYTKYTPFTGFNSPLYNRKGEILYFATLNINSTAYMWNNKGMDRSKIIIGLPTFGHSFTLVNSNNAALGSPSTGYGKLGHNGFIDFVELCHFMNSTDNERIVYDNETASPYFVSGSEWISFENMESMVNKAKFIKENDFGGAMIYSLNSDDYSGACALKTDGKFYLTRYVNNALFDYDL